MKIKGFEVKNTIPKDWEELKNCTTVPNDYKAYYNQKSLFSSERRVCIIKKVRE